MANRRMFSKIIVDSDDFLDMPVSARLLYYDLGMRADDDGFVNPKRVMRLTGASSDDLRILLVKKYVLSFENKILVIRDWKVNNFIRPDRYTPTIYKEYLKQLKTLETKQYKLSSGIPDDIPAVDPAKDSIDKERKGEVSKDKLRKDKERKEDTGAKAPVQSLIDFFYEQTKELIGIEPEISGAKEGRLLKQKLTKYTPAEIQDLIVWYLNSKDCERMGPTLSICLSAFIINKWQSNNSAGGDVRVPDYAKGWQK